MPKAKMPPKIINVPVDLNEQMVWIPIESNVYYNYARFNLSQMFERRPAAAKRVLKKLGMSWDGAWNTLLIEAGFAEAD